MNFLSDISNAMLPELMLLITVVVLVIFSAFYNVKFHKLSKWISIFGISAALYSLKYLQSEPIYYAFNESLMSDTFTIFTKALILVCSLIIVLLSKRNVTRRNHKTFQFYALLLTAVLGSMFVVSANDFLTLTISLEMLSFSMYFLIAYKKGNLSKEASFKYLITNGFATSVYLFGVSYLYGLSSTVNFNGINDYFMQNNPSVIYTLSIIFIVMGLLFKLAILPFANWILDVYEGSATSVSAFISTVPKIAVIGVLSKLLAFVVGYSFELPFVLIILSVITALWANILALRQKSILRVLACSSSANASYMLFVLSLMSVYNLSTVLFYLVTYVFMNIGVFSAVIVLENSHYSSKIHEFRGFGYSNPMFTLAFAICILGLAGFPITSGFIAKLYLFSAIIRSGSIFIPFLLVIVLSIAVSCYYYTNIVRLMFEKNRTIANEILPHKASSPIVILYTCAAITVLIGITPSALIEVCKFIAYNL